MREYIPGEVWGEMISSIDNDVLYSMCLDTEKMLLGKIVGDEPVEHFGSKTTASYWKYNIFTLPKVPFQDLYHNIVRVVKPILPDEPHVMQCWLNVFRAGESIKWHDHWIPSYRAIHGFYCVHVTSSYTEYRYVNNPDKVYRIDSKDGLLVFGKSNGDEHQSSPWQDPIFPRVTIAFDIIPISTLEDDRQLINHFIPF